MSIVCRYYKDMVPTIARHRANRFTLSRDPTAVVVELPTSDAGDARTVLEEIRSKKFPPSAAAFIPLESDVLWIQLRAPAEEPYKQGVNALREILKSYKEIAAQN